jgi:hypothetical protein
MKRFIFMLIALLFVLSASAQVPGVVFTQEVIASAGGDTSVTNLSISWTLGETIVPNYAAPDSSFFTTHMFQYKLLPTAVEENIETPVKVTVYPNPASENIKIGFDEPVDGEITLLMISSEGKPVKTDVIEAFTVEKILNLQELPAGIYYLKLTKGKLVNVYKVVKL